MAIFLSWCSALGALYMWWWTENSRVSVAPGGLTAGNDDGIRRTVRWDEILSVSPKGRVVTIQETPNNKFFGPSSGDDLFIPAGILESPSFQEAVKAMAKPSEAFVEVFRLQ